MQTNEPEHLELTLAPDVPGLVLIAQLDYPEWRATLRSPGKPANPVDVVGVLGGWQAIPIAEPGLAILNLDYEARAERLGLLLSAFSWAGWTLGLLLASRPRKPVA